MTPRPTSPPLRTMPRKGLSSRLAEAMGFVVGLSEEVAEEDALELHEIAEALRRMANAYQAAGL